MLENAFCCWAAANITQAYKAYFIRVIFGYFFIEHKRFINEIFFAVNYNKNRRKFIQDSGLLR
jgi:hypothetical protein